MEPGHVYVLLDCVILLVIATILITALVCAAIHEMSKPSAEEQRLIQIQIDKVQTERELSKLTQDYVQRVSNHAQNQWSQKGAARNRTQSNNK